MLSEAPHSDESDQALRRAECTLYRPFDDFPPELLSHILSLAWSSHCGDYSINRFRFPSILCKVNRYFNRVTLSTPTLWSYILVNSVTQLDHAQERIQSRSGAVPLALHLRFEGTPYEEASTLVERTIMQSPPRFQIITLSYSRSSIFKIPDGRSFWDHLGLLHNCPLHAVHFSIEGKHTPSTGFQLPPFTPAIRVLTLSFSQISWLPEFFPDSLEVLSIQTTGAAQVRTAQIAKLLGSSLFHSLRSLSLSYTAIEDSRAAPTQPCILYSLEHFKLSRFYIWEAALLFNDILTPSLQHLSMNILYADLNDALVASWRALHFPRLRKLTLEDFSELAFALEMFIPRLPASVTFLEIVGRHLVEHLMDPSAAMFCTNLRHIVTHGVSLDILAFLVEGTRCGSLQVLEVRYETPAQAHEGLTQEVFVRCFESLKTSVTELRVLVDGGDLEAEEPTCLTYEELLASFQGENVNIPIE